jgi:hypothetical protein
MPWPVSLLGLEPASFAADSPTAPGRPAFSSHLAALAAELDIVRPGEKRPYGFKWLKEA